MTFQGSAHIPQSTHSAYKNKPINAVLGKKQLFVVRSKQRREVHSVGRMKNFYM